LNIASSGGGGGGSGLTLTFRSLFVGSSVNKKNILLPTSLLSVSYLYNFDFDGNLRESPRKTMNPETIKTAACQVPVQVELASGCKVYECRQSRAGLWMGACVLCR
jgi:hypothetical protein